MQWKLLGGIGLVMALFLMAKYGVFGDLWGLVTGRPETWSQFTGTNAEAKIDTRLPRTTADRSPFDPMIGVQQPIQPIAAEPKKEAPAAAAAEPGWLPGRDPKSLEVVEDNTVFRGGETET